MARHRKPSLATVTRISGVAAAVFQVTGLVLVILGGWNASEGSITNLGVFSMTLAGFCVFAHVVYRRTPAVLAKREALGPAETAHTMHTAELPTVPGLTVSRDPNVTTVKVTPRRRPPHNRVESKK